MEQKGFGNDYDHTSTLRFLRRWWKLLLIVFVASATISLLVSLLITPRYKSTAVLFPTSSNRISKAILADRYSLDFMDYGIERDCEYAIQILSSQSMEDAVCARFGLAEHYGVAPNDPHRRFKLHDIYRGNVTVRRTDNLGVEVSVLDVDAQWAADIANFIAANYDTLSNAIQSARAHDACTVMQGVCDTLENDIRALEDSMRNSTRYNVGRAQLISRKCKELAELQTRLAETKVDLEQQISYKFWLDKASPADKKAYPKRLVIVLLSSLGALAMCILVLLIAGRTKKETR